MDRDVRNALIVCLASVVAVALVFALRVRPPAPARLAPAGKPKPAAPASPAGSTSAPALKDSGDVPLTQFALQQWAGAIEGEETGEDEEINEMDEQDEDAKDEAEGLVSERPGKRRKKTADLGLEEMEKLLDEEDDEDEKAGDDEDDRSGSGEEPEEAAVLKSPEAFAAVMAAEDAESATEEAAGEPEGSGPLGEDSDED